MWPGITYETCTWERDPDDLALIPKSCKRKILPTYEAAVPASIAALPVEIPAPLVQRLAEVEVSLARFDTAQAARDWALPALLLRSESSSSSQIERLTDVLDLSDLQVVVLEGERRVPARVHAALVPRARVRPNGQSLGVPDAAFDLDSVLLERSARVRLGAVDGLLSEARCTIDALAIEALMPMPCIAGHLSWRGRWHENG